MKEDHEESQEKKEVENKPELIDRNTGQRMRKQLQFVAFFFSRVKEEKLSLSLRKSFFCTCTNDSLPCHDLLLLFPLLVLLQSSGLPFGWCQFFIIVGARAENGPEKKCIMVPLPPKEEAEDEEIAVIFKWDEKDKN